MSSVQKVLQRVIVTRFYQVNAGFFLFLFLLLFGIIEPIVSIRFHYALMQMMAHRLLLLLLGMLVWTLYYIKCVRYLVNTLSAPAHTFLYQLQALPRPYLRRHFSACLAALFMPALLYVTCTAVVSVSERQYGTLAFILLYQALVFAISTVICLRPILLVAKARKPTYIGKIIRKLRPQTIGYYQYLGAYLLQSKRVLFLLLKAGSLLLLQLMVVLNKEALHLEGTYFFLLLIVAAHALIPYHFVRFTEANSWLRALPATALQRYGYFAGTYAALFLPELAFLLLHTHTSLSIAGIASLYTLAVCMLCAMHALLYLPRAGIDRYSLVLFVMLPLTMILLPAVSIWWLAAGWLFMSILLFAFLYRRYEVIME